MKKIYKAPLTEVVKVNAEQMICVSGEGFSLSESNEYNSGSMQIGGLGDEQYDDFDW